MKVTDKIRSLPKKVKKQMKTAVILLCAACTFAVPAFGDGYSIVQDEAVVSSAASIEDVDLLLVASSAFGEARKVMNATDPDAKDQFIANTASIVTSSKWHNIGLIVGARDSLSGSTWSMFQSPITLSATEVATYGDSTLAEAYNKYKAFGFAVQNLNNRAKKSNNTAVSIDAGLDAMSAAAIKLGSFGVEFLNDYNPGPVLLSFYDSSNLSRYSSNKLVKIVTGNEALKSIVCLFGDKVPGTRVSFFLIINAVLATVGLGLSMLLTLLGNRSIGDGIRHFLIRIAIGTVGVYLIANVMSTMLEWVTDTILDVGSSSTASYVEENLNLYDWYLTGFQLPSGVQLQIDDTGNFIFTPEIVRSINEYTYRRLVSRNGSDEAIKARMERYTQNANVRSASFVTPSFNAEDSGAAWSTDVYYALMNNYAQNKDLMDGNDDEGSPLYGQDHFSIYMCRYLWMSSLTMTANGEGWIVKGNGMTTYYGLNPISAFNLVRSDFSGESITASSSVFPVIAYVAFDVVNTYDTTASANMNSIMRFIACFTLVLASFKGLITIFTAGFGGLFSGGVKTAMGSSGGLGQALGGVFALLFGIIGISVIMSMTMSLLDTVYGIARELIGDTEVIDAFLDPIQEAMAEIPVVGPILINLCRSVAEMIMTLVLSLTFPKLGGIPIAVFSQYMADLPGRMAERAQMIEGMLLSGRSSAGGGLPPRPGGRGSTGQYGRSAQAMAGQAFSSSMKQAGAIIGAGTAAAGSLAGASLSSLGKAANKKGDAIEGKPENPGVKNWDDMSPEQQSRAAETAAATEGWENMSEEARQNALNAAGVYDENNAQGGGSTDGTIENDPAGGDAESVSGTGGEEESGMGMEGSGEAMEAEAAEAEAMEEGTLLPDIGMEASMGTAEAMEADMDGQSVSGDAADGGDVPGMGGEATDTPAPGSAESADSVNVEGDTLVGGNQAFDTSVDQMNNIEAQGVDMGQQAVSESAGEPGLGNIPGMGSPEVVANVPGGMGSIDIGTAGAQAAKDAAGGAHIGNSLPMGTRSSTGRSGAQQSGASATYKSVNNMSQTDGNTSMHMNAQANQNNQVHGNTGQNRSLNTGDAGEYAQAGQDIGQGADRQAQRAANIGAASQSMNVTAASRWGKEMSVKEQKQARAMHAVGDALQMMGGNRTMGDGIREAMSFAKDAALTYSVPEELQNNDFATSLRVKRMEREQRRNRRNGR